MDEKTPEDVPQINGRYYAMVQKVKDQQDAINALVEALESAMYAMRHPIDDWKCVYEKEALGKGDAALALAQGETNGT